jgi:hypothetical protein
MLVINWPTQFGFAKEADMSTQPAASIDWTTEFTPEQWDALQDAYARGHSWGMDSLETLDKYVLFSHENIPDALKRFKALVGSFVPSSVENANPAFVPAVFHYYCILRYNQGIRYYFNTLRSRGAKKAEIADIIALSWLHSSPFGMNVVATTLHDVMHELDADEGTGLSWPDDWQVDPEAFSSGVDFSAANGNNAISRDDLEKIEQWHERVEGEVPRYVSFLAKYNPLALKAFRARFETSTQRRTLPKQAIASCFVQYASVTGQPDALRRALHMARSFGMKRAHVVTLFSLNLVYNGHVQMDRAIEGVEQLLEGWD